MVKPKLISPGQLALALTAALLLAANAWAQGAVQKHQVMVPMRDGVQLATNIYLPVGDGPGPVVLTRTPDNKNGADRSDGLSK